MMDRPPVFCLSLPRNGTLSLAAAFAALGWRSFHAPLELQPQWYDQPGAFFSDTPVYAPDLFAALDQAYPAARFVYVHRDPDQWLRSIQRSGIAAWHSGTNERVHPVDRRCYQHVFGLPFEPARWRARYLAHQQAVWSRFAGRSNFLAIRLNDLAWEPLCRWVGAPLPDLPFPRLNQQVITGPGRERLTGRLET